MLQGLRRSAGSWVVKALMGLLVLSFAVWGIADIFTGYRGTAVATVGNTEIDGEEFRQKFQNEIRIQSRQLGRPIGYDVARSLGLDTRVLSNLVSEAALDDFAARMRLRVTDEAVAADIRADPSFRGPSGKFDRQYFEAAIRSLGYSEAGYVAERRQLMARQALADAVGGEFALPDEMELLIARYRFEGRRLRYMVVTEAQAGNPTEPTQEELKTFFEENKAQFGAPEYRKISAIRLEPKDLAGDVAVSDEDIAATYESQISKYTTPERRRIKQIVFPSKAEAEAAAKAIADGRKFDDIAFERGLKPGDYELGLVAEKDIADPTVAKAAFALGAGDTSGVIDGRFGPVIVQVADVVAGGTKPLDAVKEDIRREIALSRAQQEVLDLFDSIEDDRAAGLTLAEIGAKKKLPFLTVDAVDAEGNAPDGSAVELPQKDDVIRAAFESDVGIENDPVQLGQNGFLWFDVDAITPARDRTLEEAGGKVRDALMAKRRATRLDEFADGLADRVRHGENMADVAKEAGVPLTLTRALTRADRGDDFDAPALQTAFSTPQGGIATVTGAEPGSRVVFKVEEIVEPKTAGDALPEQIASDLRNGYSDDLVSEYIQGLQSRLSITINRQAMDRALGLSEPGS